ncbi:MAG: DegT/DnrJ/EryC1/StrS family aminotransferase [Candidatus Nealsonbacteria bacterium]
MYFVHPQIKLTRLKKANLSQKLSYYFPDKQCIFTDMGRSAFKIIIEKLGLQGAEILMPAYICDIFSSVFEQYNIRPIFLDIDLKTFHIKSEEIENKITPDTKAIFICHTYGLMFDIEKIKKFGLPIIEDCAHAFGIKPKSEIAFFSLYKQFPALRGGMLVCPKDWNVQLRKTSFNFRDFISLLNCFPIFAFLFKKFGRKIAPKMLRKEKFPEPAGINGISLKLFTASLNDFEKSLDKRKKLALFFQSEIQKLGFEVQEPQNNLFCYLSALIPKSLELKRDKVVEDLRKHFVFCNRIWREPIVLDKEAFPNTFEAAKRIINFPLQNHYKEKDIKKMVDAVKKVVLSV